jgi:hypothetical protein
MSCFLQPFDQKKTNTNICLFVNDYNGQFFTKSESNIQKMLLAEFDVFSNK